MGYFLSFYYGTVFNLSIISTILNLVSLSNSGCFFYRNFVLFSVGTGTNWGLRKERENAFVIESRERHSGKASFIPVSVTGFLCDAEQLN